MHKDDGWWYAIIIIKKNTININTSLRCGWFLNNASRYIVSKEFVSLSRGSKHSRHSASRALRCGFLALLLELINTSNIVRIGPKSPILQSTAAWDAVSNVLGENFFSNIK